MSKNFGHMILAAALTSLLLPVRSAAQTVALRIPPRRPVEVAQSRGGMVVSETALASEIGAEILRKGGSAVDAAIAVGIALEVSWPEAGNIGGGGFMMIAQPDTDVSCIDYREKAPLSTDERSLVPYDSPFDIRFVGTPGTLRGFELAHQRHGRLPWRQLIQPSIVLARDGIVVDELLAWSLNSVLTRSIMKHERFDEFRRVYGGPHDGLWKAGDRLVQPDLAGTLQEVATHGADAFYRGTVGDLLVAEMTRQRGWITREDLKQYRPVMRSAVSRKFCGFEVCGAPPPSSGGTVVSMQLGMIDRLGLTVQAGQVWTADHIHLIAEVMKRCYRDRAAWLGDQDFVSIPAHLTTDRYLREQAAGISSTTATPSRSIAGDIPVSEGPYESPQTTHFSVVDADGMAVSNTYTLEQNFGSRIVVPGAGIVLNNEMGDFNRIPGYTNTSGMIGTSANLLKPGKRMLSSMTPTIVRCNGKVRLLLGSPGGRTIINTVTLVLVQRLLFGRSLEESVNAPRFHHQWFPDEIRLEGMGEQEFSDLLSDLRSRGHQVVLREGSRQGSCHAIEIDPDTGIVTGVADWRRGGAARGTAESSEN